MAGLPSSVPTRAHPTVVRHRFGHPPSLKSFSSPQHTDTQFFMLNPPSLPSTTGGKKRDREIYPYLSPHFLLPKARASSPVLCPLGPRDSQRSSLLKPPRMLCFLQDGEWSPAKGSRKALRDAQVQLRVRQMGTLSHGRDGVLTGIPRLLPLPQVLCRDYVLIHKIRTSLGTTDASENLKKALNPALTQRYEGTSKEGPSFSSPANKSPAMLLAL